MVVVVVVGHVFKHSEGNLFGPFKKPGRSPGSRGGKRNSNKSAASAVSFQGRQTVLNETSINKKFESRKQ